MRTAATVAGIVLALTALAFAGFVTPEELSERDAWAKAWFSPPGEATRPIGLVVLANHYPVIRNGRGGEPLSIAGKKYSRGLYCHANSKVVVYLPAPGKSFSAIVGIDSNEQTRPEKGSVVFSVGVAGKEAFVSPVMREGMAGLSVAADLKGASSFTLEISDAGDGISCDQSDWAEAKVVLQDGKELWVGNMPFVDTGAKGLPFSFVYGDKASSQLLPTWTRTEEIGKAQRGQAPRRTITWTDPATGLEVRCEIVEYQDFPTLEWTLHFRNTSATETPILSDIQAIDLSLSREPAGEFLLHHNACSQATLDDYRPLVTPLGPGKSLRVSSSGGRGSDGVWPYFNLDWGGQGAIVVIGWPGQWNGSFTRDNSNGLRIRAGQEQTHFKLLPGEEVRSPLAVVQFYTGEWLRGQNIWRRWMAAHNIPRLDGKLPPPLVAAGSNGELSEMQNANEANQKLFISAYVDHGIPLNFWWMDAGWYPFKTGWWNVGTWEPDPKRFPNGLRAVTDFAHSKGVKALLWFEPERVTAGSWLYQNHPEWLLGKDGGDKLLYLGNKDAREWLTNHIDQLMKEQGIDIYRQDFNFPPLNYWRANDSPDRQGITEIRHIEGYLAFWDELRRRHPGLLIDTCASGGRRNDLETLRRSVPLHKSDMEYSNLNAKQTQFYGLALWEPYFGAPVYPAERVDVYGFRCGISMLSGMSYPDSNVRSYPDRNVRLDVPGGWRKIWF
jgi:alpha-galactosidase